MSKKVWIAGLAMFSMFFGSGNLVFPIALGQITSGQNLIAGIGLCLTAVVVPFLGVLGMILYDGSHKNFFRWVGRIPQLLICGGIIALIGPFGVLPRCLTISHASVVRYFPSFPLLLFSLLGSALIFYILARKGKFLDVLGSWLTPPLILSLLAIVTKGLWQAPAVDVAAVSASHAFGKGLIEGYNTLDLLAAVFFSATVMQYFRDEKEKTVGLAFKAGVIGLGLLGLVYFAFIFLGASYSGILAGVAPEQLLLTIAHTVLGPIGGFVATIAIGLACLTTAVALASVSARFVASDLLKERFPEWISLAAILLVSCFVSTFEFSGIARFLSPVLFYAYPFVIGLTLINLGMKVWRKPRREMALESGTSD